MEILKRLKLMDRLAPVQIIVLGFAAVILAGTLLLMLPFAAAEGKATSFLTALFTSTSAVCVTGLVVVDTGTYWSVFGQLVILLLIQIGGLGFMSFATLIALLLGRKITLKKQLIMQEAMNSFSMQGLINLAKHILAASFIIEGIGAVLLSVKFVPVYGIIKGIYFSIFHAVSAYCNAGFDIIGNFRSLITFQESFIVNFAIMGLIIIGGLGFIVQSELYESLDFKKYSLHTKVAIITTIIFLAVGFVIFFILEFNNPDTMKPLSFKGKIFASLFASVTPRTAGFNTIPTDLMTMPSKLLTIILMYIGASPGSTGGGIKTTTTAIILMSVVSVIMGKSDVEVFKRRLPADIIYRSFAIAFISLTLIVIDVLILSVTENGAKLVEIIYEATSAFGTVGLSIGLTSKLSSIGKLLILLTMFAGRVGPLTLLLAFVQRQQKNNSSIRYPEDKLLVG